MSGTPKVVLLPGAAADASVPATITESSDLPEDAWIRFDAPGKLTSKHPRSTRETTFTGPGRFRSCVGHGEEAWVERGKFESQPAAGERPGAEEWVVTPAGVVRYGGGRVELDVSLATATAGPKVEVKVSSGAAFAWTAEESSVAKSSANPAPSASASVAAASSNEGWIRIDGPKPVTLSVKKPGKAEDLATAAVDQCKANAKTTKDLATSLAAPDAALSQLAPKHVIARRLARAACAVGEVRTALLEPSATRDTLLVSLKEAEADWKQSRPRGPHGRFH